MWSRKPSGWLRDTQRVSLTSDASHVDGSTILGGVVDKGHVAPYQGGVSAKELHCAAVDRSCVVANEGGSHGHRACKLKWEEG